MNTQEARPWTALLVQRCEILPKRIKFHVEKKQLLLKFECISEDEVEVPISSKLSRFHLW